MNKNRLAMGMASLFIISTLTPLTVGINIKTNESEVELERMLDNLHFICTIPDDFSEEKYEHYKKQFLSRYSLKSSSGDMGVESLKEDLLPPWKPLSNPISSNGPMDSAWPIAYHDAHHTGQSQYSTAGTTNAEKWRFYADGMIEDTPVINNDGIIYFGEGWDLIAVNSDGTEKWMFRTSGLILGSSPAIDIDGTIYVGSWDTKLYAINPDGTLKWKSPGTGGNIASSPVIADDGTIYFGTMSSGNSIVAVNPDGTIKWSYPTGYSIVSDPCIGDDGTIYIGSGDNYLYAMNPDGTLKWRFKTGDWIQGHPSIAADGTIYIGSFDGYLYALYQNGTLKWKCGVGPGTETNPSIANDGTIYVGSDKLYAIYSNGTVRWSFIPGAERFIISSPAISTEGTIYFGTNIDDVDGGEIIAVNPNGTERWRKRIATDWVDSSPSIAEDGTVYIGCAFAASEGYLHAFGIPDNNEPPSIPTIKGTTNGNTGVKYTYTLTSDDPENYPVKYYVEWGDDTHSGWTEEYASGEEGTVRHTWSEEGTFTIRAKAIDISNSESDWGTLTVTMPRSRAVNNFFIKFLENYPIVFLIFRYLKGL